MTDSFQTCTSTRSDTWSWLFQGGGVRGGRSSPAENGISLFISKGKKKRLLNSSVQVMSVDFERKIVPGVILVSVSLDVVAMCSGGWLLGYWGDIVVLRVSPWSACKLRCLYCADERPTFDCFPIQGSLANSNFGKCTLQSNLPTSSCVSRNNLFPYYQCGDL